MAIGHGCRPSWVGVGRVVAVGAGVRQLKEGDRTRVPVLHPCGAERIKPDGPWLRPLPPGDINQVRHNGRQSADRLSPGDRHRNLPRGSWVTQNGASSGVGWATVAIAKSLGLRAVNLVRRDEVVEEMKALGGNGKRAGTPENDLRPRNGRTRVGYRYMHMYYNSNYEMLIHEYWRPKIPLPADLGKIASSLLSSPEIVPLNSAADPGCRPRLI